MYLTKVQGAPEGKRRCFRCLGKKKMYKAMGGWSSVNSGGEEVNCPMCNGSGWIDKLPEDVEFWCSIADVEEQESKNVKGKGQRRKSKAKEY